jgi:DNA ligase-1
LPVSQRGIKDAEDLLMFEEKALELGFEGVMVRDPHGPYKHGRSTEREGWLLKLKQFADSEASVLDTMAFQHNANEATKNELGHTKRSTAKAGMVDLPKLGKLMVRDLKTGVEFEVGTGFTMEEREELWKVRNKLVGRILKYKYFPTGGKDKPRFPIFLGWCDRRDM